MSRHSPISRGEFLTYLYKNSVSAIVEAASALTGLSPGDKGKWVPVAVRRDIGLEPKLFLAPEPVYLFLREGRIQALSPVCPDDGHLVTWRPQADDFYCPKCRNAFARSGRPRSANGSPLSTHACDVREGTLWIALHARRGTTRSREGVKPGTVALDREKHS